MKLTQQNRHKICCNYSQKFHDLIAFLFWRNFMKDRKFIDKNQDNIKQKLNLIIILLKHKMFNGLEIKQVNNTYTTIQSKYIEIA